MSHDEKVNDFLLESEEMGRKHFNGKITDDKFDNWMLSFPNNSRNLKKGSKHE